MKGELLRLAAFDAHGEGGNPAGVWLGEELPDPAEMQQIAAEVGYSETAFHEKVDTADWITRYYSPEAEVSFCGHATIATGVALGQRHGPSTYHLETAVGDVTVEVTTGEGDSIEAVLTSVEPMSRDAQPELVESVLEKLGWKTGDLDRSLPPALSYAGAWHLILPVSSRELLSQMSYDFEGLKSVMAASDLTTIQIVFREGPDLFHSRNPFPVGGVVEDPATGAAAAALGAYLREQGEVIPPVSLIIRQGFDMGRPSILEVNVPETGGVRVGGTAVPIEGY